MKRMLQSWLFWYWVCVAISAAICYLVHLYLGNTIQDWMYLRHQSALSWSINLTILAMLFRIILRGFGKLYSFISKRVA